MCDLPAYLSEPPAHLSDRSRRLWQEIIAGGLIDAPCIPILISLCESFDRREQARAEIAASGAVVKDRWGVPKVSPWCAIERDATLIFQRSFRLLGFDQAPTENGQSKLF
jgi:phage terminase small subunit